MQQEISKTFSDYEESVLRRGNMLDDAESPQDMLARVAGLVIGVEGRFGATYRMCEEFRDEVMSLLEAGAFVPSTPILTNAGRRVDRPLSACCVPPVDLRGDFARVKASVDGYHVQGMGTGFDFNGLENPVAMMRMLDAVADAGLKDGSCERPVGNMGVLSAYHPRLREFVRAKLAGGVTRFNLSVDADAAFMAAAESGGTAARDGREVDAAAALREIASAAHACGDPGMIFLDRMNADNPTPELGDYVSAAPCGEVGLAPGETCQFGSVNLAKALTGSDGEARIDYDAVARTVKAAVRYLDDVLEYGLSRYSSEKSTLVMGKKRKLGVGVCGFADALVKMGVPYGSREAVRVAEDVMSFVAYQAKRASVALAASRGEFPAFKGSRYAQGEGLILRRFAGRPTSTVSSADWEALDADVRADGMRNATLTALPPTGRSGAVFGCSPQVEPLFTLTGPDGQVRPDFVNALRAAVSGPVGRILEGVRRTGTCAHEAVPAGVRDLFRTATELGVDEHLSVVEAFQRFTDEGVSKTVNLPNSATVEDFERVYRGAYARGLKGVTAYRDGSRGAQPVKLSS